MSLFSKSCTYGLRAVLFVVGKQGQRPFVPIHEIADHLGLSFHFLTKILQKLTEDGLMISYRGPKGGVTLAQPAREVSLMQIIESLDGPDLFTSCVLGLEGCGDRKPCPLHKRWTEERARLKKVFEGATLAEVSRRAVSADLRLAD
jgi:Rrf2 family protein